MGTVLEVGSNVKNFAVGDCVGVGCMVWSCQQCDSCGKAQEQYCDKVVWTYNGIYGDGSPTFGGYSSWMVCDQRYIYSFTNLCIVNKFVLDLGQLQF